ncbi:MAG: lamin tail domain-containing protein [Candidatus Sumerlaeia bacterium]|nr:lamin tail domain-containing protein [Candidatus Sumerlaeia bacterium]
MRRQSAMPTAAAVLAGIALAAPAPAKILITEVLPGVTTSTTNGDTVELYNTGPGAVNLTDWVLTDLDPNSVEADLMSEGTFAPASLSLPDLAAGDFAVIVFANDTASYTVTNYGLRIVSTASMGTLDVSDQLLLLDSGGTPIDSVAWSLSDDSPDGTTITDRIEDLSALTGPTPGYGITSLGDAEWDGPDTIADHDEYRANTVDFTGLSTINTWGGGAIRRRSTDGVFEEASPDGPAQWEAIARHDVRLGNPSDPLVTVDGLRPIRKTGDLADWLSNLDTSNFPARRIARLADQSPADFVLPSNDDLDDWDDVLALALAGSWDEAFAAAAPLGYEVVEFLDTATNDTFHILREATVPGEAGFRGMGIFVFDDNPATRPYLTLQAPHPRFDSNTLAELALAVPQVRPRAALIAGTHRRNHTTTSTCDGTDGDGNPYRISDVAHHTQNFFHRAHIAFDGALPDPIQIQFHGFCCPGSGNYTSLSDDVVLSTGVSAVPGPQDFVALWRARIDAQNYFAASGTDLTTAVVFGDGATVLGATTNVQGRISNGVALGDACNTAAGGATGRFIHIEQDPDVRTEPQHILTALIEALDQFETIPVELDLFRVD